MSAKNKLNCLKFSLLALGLLLFQAVTAQYHFEKVDGWIKDNLEELGGRAVLMVYKDGKVVYNKSENNVTQRQKIVAKIIARRSNTSADDLTADLDSKSRIRIASSSKWLSAALVMTFIDEGKLSLKDTVGKYLPVLSPSGKGRITIQQCLPHLTAIKAPPLKESLQEMRQINSMDQAIAEIATLPMEGEPGKVFHYSNVGLQITGAVIEKISGKSFEQLFAERIASPCQMKSTDFGEGKVALPAGGAISTAEDYQNFLIMILNNGTFNGKQVLKPASVALMQQNYVKGATIAYSPAEAGSWGYGFGEWVMEETGKRSLAVTSPGLFGSFPWVDNDKKYTGLLFCLNLKSKGRNEKYRELKQLIDEALSK